MNFNDIVLITEMAKKVKLIGKPMVDYAIMEALLNGDGDHLREISKYLIQPRYIQQIACPDPFFPNSKGVDGEKPLGFINQTNAILNINLNTDPVRNCGLFGSTRSGKSTVMRYFLINHKGKFFAVDFKKDESRRLLNVNKNIGIFNKLFFPLLEIPKNVPYEVHRNSLVMDICQAFGLLTGSEGFCLDALDKTYKKYNFRPTLEDFYRELKLQNAPRNGPEYQFLGRITNRINFLLLSIGNTYYLKEHYFEELIERLDGIVLELDGYPPEIKIFVSLRILSWFYNYASYNRTDPIILAFDEIYPIFNIVLESSIQPSLASYYINTIAARKLSIIGLSQQPCKVSNSFLANTPVKICFRLYDGENISTISRAMNLTREQAQVIPLLKEGQAIILTPECEKPELIQIPYFEILDRSISDNYVRDHMKKLLGENGSRQNNNLKQLSVPNVSEDKEVNIDDFERKFLMSVYLNSFKYKTQHFKDFNLGGYRGEKIIKQMIKKGLIKENEIRTGRRGKPIILLELTDKAFEILNLNKKYNPKEGSLEHRFWKEKVKEWALKEGHKAVIEHNKYGKSVDIVVIEDEKETAIEIQLTERYLIENIREDLKYFDNVIITCHGNLIEEFKKIVKESISEEDLEKIEFRHISEYLQ